MKFKVGDEVIIIEDTRIFNCQKYKNFKNSLTKIIYISKNNKAYRIEVINCPYKKECQRYNNTNPPFCVGCHSHEIKSLSQLKLKKFVAQK